mgnify:CR=1 FL=1
MLWKILKVRQLTHFRPAPFTSWLHCLAGAHVHQVAALSDGFFELLDLLFEHPFGNIELFDLVEVHFGLGPFPLIGLDIGQLEID